MYRYAYDHDDSFMAKTIIWLIQHESHTCFVLCGRIVGRYIEWSEACIWQKDDAFMMLAFVLVTKGIHV